MAAVATRPHSPGAGSVGGGSASSTDRVDLRAAVDRMLARWPSVGLAVGLVRAGRLDQVEARGYADLRSRIPVTPQTVVRVGSITKTMTAVAVLQLRERGLLNLDAPAAHVLRAYRLVARVPHWPQPTIRQLLTHTAGLPDVRRFADLLDFRAGPWDARPPLGSVPFGEELPTLAKYYADGLEVVALPGSAFAYSNHGFATLGQIVEDVSGMPLARYMDEHLFEPLGMQSSGLVRTRVIAGRLATGYLLGSDGPTRVADRDWMGAGAGGAYSTLDDLAAYAIGLMDGSAGARPVLDGSSAAQLFDRQYETHPDLPAMGLGIFRTDVRGEPVVHHDGILPGFNSHLALVPGRGIGLIALTNGSNGAMRWLPGEMKYLLRDLLHAHDERPRDVPHHPEIWRRISGRYLLPPRVSDLRGRLAMGGGVQIFVRRGRPMLRLRLPLPAVWSGFPMYGDVAADPLAFWVDLSAIGIGNVRMRFGEQHGRMSLHTDLGGQPITLERARSRRVKWHLGRRGLRR
jgi:CubicO group peptidase (beta-lactamase class C family)